MDLQVLEVKEARQVPRGQLAPPDHLGLVVSVVSLDLLDNQDPQDRLGLQAQLVRQVLEENLAPQGLQGPLVQWDLLDPRVHLDLVGKVELMAIQDLKVLLDLQAHLVSLICGLISHYLYDVVVLVVYVFLCQIW